MLGGRDRLKGSDTMPIPASGAQHHLSGIANNIWNERARGQPREALGKNFAAMRNGIPTK